jgi:acyl-CoA thioester hydrolase
MRRWASCAYGAQANRKIRVEMSRLKLEFPACVHFETELTVRISDINYGQHVGNDAVLALAHEARLQFLAAHGMSEQDAGGAGLIMLDAEIVYRAQAKWGDALVAQIALGEVRACDFDLYYRFVRKSGSAEIAILKTTLAFYDYRRQRVVRAPEAFRSLSGKLA